MAGGGGGGGSMGVSKERAKEYQGKVTSYVIIACIVAATGGSLFGYDIGISGLSSFPNPSSIFIFHLSSFYLDLLLPLNSPLTFSTPFF